MASPIAATWANATILIETPTGGRGTGFLVGRPIGDDQWRIFLLTNKHVLAEDPADRVALQSVRLHINIEHNRKVVGEVVEYPVRDENGLRHREHPEDDVDVLAINAIPLFNRTPKLRNQFVPEELFGTADKRQELDITAGEEIVVVGYPSGIRQGRTNHPLIRDGIIATRIGEELHEEVPQDDGSIAIRVSRGFLIDGATIPGSSGSPVVLKPVTGAPAREYCHGSYAAGLIGNCR